MINFFAFSPHLDSRPPPSEPSSFSHARRFFPSTRPRRQEISSSFPWQFGSVDNHIADATGESSPNPQSENARNSQESLSFAPSLTLPSIESYQSIPPESTFSHSDRHRLRRVRAISPTVLVPRPFSFPLGDEPSEHPSVVTGRVSRSTGAEEASVSEPEDSGVQRLRLRDQVDSLHPSQFLTHQENSEQYS
jgi:hypothetical protein